MVSQPTAVYNLQFFKKRNIFENTPSPQTHTCPNILSCKHTCLISLKSFYPLFYWFIVSYFSKYSFHQRKVAHSEMISCIWMQSLNLNTPLTLVIVILFKIIQSPNVQSSYPNTKLAKMTYNFTNLCHAWCVHCIRYEAGCVYNVS